MTRSLTVSFAALAASTALAAPAYAVGVGLQGYTSVAEPVQENAEFDDEAPLPRIQTDFTVDTRNANEDFTEGTVSVGYQVEGSGFNDLSGIPGAAHLVHMHSQFEENESKSDTTKAGILSQLSGDFLSGDGGNPVPTPAPVPGVEDKAALLGNPDYLNFAEEVPASGLVSFYLGKTGIEAPEDGESPLFNLLDEIRSGDIDPKAYLPDGSEFSYENVRSFDLSDPDQRRLILNVIGADGTEFDERLFDAHGFSTPKDLSDSIDAALFGVADPDRSQATVNGLPTLLSGVPLGDGTEFRVTGPAVEGEDIVPTEAIVAPIPLPAGLPLLFAGLGGLGALRARRTAKG